MAQSYSADWPREHWTDSAPVLAAIESGIVLARPDRCRNFSQTSRPLLSTDSARRGVIGLPNLSACLSPPRQYPAHDWDDPPRQKAAPLQKQSSQGSDSLEASRSF